MSSPLRRAASVDPSPPSPGESLPDRVAAGLRQRARRSLDGLRAAADARWGRPRDESRPIYLVAPAGHPNHGDEQLLAGWLRYLRHRLPGTPVVVDCHTPGQAAVLHHAEHPDVLFTDTLWRLAGEHAGHEPSAAVADSGADPAAAAVAFCRHAVADLGTRPALASGIELLRSASIIHLIGGGYVNDQWPHHLGVVAGAAEAGRLADANVVATGQGFAPFADVGSLADALAGFDLVTVRDAASRDLLAGTDAPVHLVGDDGWLSLAGGGGIEAGDHPVYSDDPHAARDLVLCAQSDLAEPEVVAAAVARILAAWKIPGERITVVESIPGGDRVVWDLVCARADAASATGAGTVGGGDDDEVGRALAGMQLPMARFVPFQELWATGLPARSGQVWLTTRFHPHLFAAARGASGVALRSGSAYYDVKHASLADAGSPWVTVNAHDVVVDPQVPNPPTAGGFDSSAVSALIAAAEALADEVYPL
ncbi:polysaccharide pyruvyl transferase family protein [Dietzia aurantiaca]|uniref:polysaccharide pyruvyl transferase family protein n=1 Tax=Dietzia aurantiaca TaxID=983873 RepID=UPI001E591581|nr:polysaccharide pyruvyl transferase family protein [Dietzia aurantiaca]MCD2264095.1 polysaccharide pyruvyl transferase family protein [Dietzia aurantiaca]